MHWRPNTDDCYTKLFPQPPVETMDVDSLYREIARLGCHVDSRLDLGTFETRSTKNELERWEALYKEFAARKN